MIITAAAIQFMPDRMPAHYNFAGEIDRYGSKYEKLIFPVVIMLMTAAWLGAIAAMNKKSRRRDLDEKQRKDAAANVKALYYVAIASTLFETAVQCGLLYQDFQAVKGGADGLNADYYKISGVIMGISIVVVANVVPKVKRNALVGIRTKWSLADDETWSATNRFGGGLLAVGGLCIITESLILDNIITVIIAIAILLACCGMCVLYSYLVYTGRKRV